MQRIFSTLFDRIGSIILLVLLAIACQVSHEFSLRSSYFLVCCLLSGISLPVGLCVGYLLMPRPPLTMCDVTSWYGPATPGRCETYDA